MGKMIGFINAIRNTQCEEDVEMLLCLSTPLADKVEMGNLYDEILGYNPITYYDEKVIRDIATEVESKTGVKLEDIDSIVLDILNEVENAKATVISETLMAYYHDLVESSKISGIVSIIASNLDLDPAEIINFDDELDDDDDDVEVTTFDYTEEEED